MNSDERLSSPLIAALRFSTYFVFTLCLIPLQALFLTTKSRYRASFPPYYHRVCCRILGLDLRLHGKVAPSGPTLFVSNHVSYLDIIVLSAVTPLSFISKAEVASWPGAGLLAKLQRTVYVNRRKADLPQQRTEIMQRLDAGDRLVLFAEGTSSDGNRVLPFRSALFAAVETNPGDGRVPVAIQPVTIAYTALNGIPLGYQLRPYYAWYGDMEMAPHFWQWLGMGKITIHVIFHPPVRIADFSSRKLLAEHCQKAVASGLSTILSGRLPEGG